MKVKIVKPVGRFLRLWGELVKSAPNACFWSTPIWVNAIADAYKWKPFLFVAEIKNSPIVIPSVRTKKTLVFGTYDSFPFGYGAVLAEKPLDENILGELFESISKLKIASLIINLPPGHPVLKSSDFLQIRRAFTHVLPLTFDKTDLLNRFSQTCRWRVKRAIKAGIEVKRVDVAGGIEILGEIYKSWAKMKRPENVYSDKLLENIGKFPDDIANFYVAEHNGVGVACILNFLWRNEVYNFMAVDIRQKSAAGAINLLHYQAVRDSIDIGATRYVFGESLGIKSLERFKESFGAQKAPVYSVKVEGRGYKKLKRVVA